MTETITSGSTEPNRQTVWRDTDNDLWRWGHGEEGEGWFFSSGHHSWEDVVTLFHESFPWTLVSGPTVAEDFVVKDSGVRQEYDNGFVRDVETDKPDFTRLLMIEGIELVPIEYLERFASHMAKGAVKYGRENWRQAQGDEPLARFRRSATRHFIQWLRGDRDEDHGVAVGFNIAAAEYVRDQTN